MINCNTTNYFFAWLVNFVKRINMYAEKEELSMKDKVGIYCRLSDEDRYKKDKSDDSESIANQKSMLFKICFKP